MIDEKWRKLKVGDRVRIVQLPSDSSLPGYIIHPDTVKLYNHLIEKQIILEIDSIDEFGHPWIEYVEIDGEGRKIYHGLALNEDSWILIDGSEK